MSKPDLENCVSTEDPKLKGANRKWRGFSISDLLREKRNRWRDKHTQVSMDVEAKIAEIIQARKDGTYLELNEYPQRLTADEFKMRLLQLPPLKPPQNL